MSRKEHRNVVPELYYKTQMKNYVWTYTIKRSAYNVYCVVWFDYSLTTFEERVHANTKTIYATRKNEV